MTIAWDDPQRAEQDLIAATESCPHPEPFRALLKFYRLRAAPKKTILKTAYRYFQLTDKTNDPLQLNAVEECFIGEAFARERPVPLDFIHAVWQATAIRAAEVGNKLAPLLFGEGRVGAGISIILDTLDSSKLTLKVIANSLHLLRSAKELELAQGAINRFKDVYAGDESFGREWIRLVTVTRNGEAAAEIAALTPLQAQSPSEYLADLYLLLGKREHAKEVMLKYLATLNLAAYPMLSRRVPRDLRRVCEELGLRDELTESVKTIRRKDGG